MSRRIYATPAPAKVNLYLHVGPPRPDGRHPIDSLVMFADGAADDLRFFPSSHQGYALSVTDASGAALHLTDRPGDNFILIAAAALWPEGGGRFELVKRLPIASGLGGGTADGAAALRLLDRHARDTGRSFTPEALDEAARTLGGDGLACLYSKVSLMRGDGAELTRLTGPPRLPAILINSGAACATGPVYDQFDALGGGADFYERPPPSSKTVDQFIEALDGFRNDLTEPAEALAHGVSDVLEEARSLTDIGLVRMSGSGATVFALFRTQEAAKAAAATLVDRHPDWWVTACMLGDASVDVRVDVRSLKADPIVS